MLKQSSFQIGNLTICFRRGSALAELSYYSEAIIEFEEASKLIPDKKQEVLKNVERIKALMKNDDSPDS